MRSGLKSSRQIYKIDTVYFRSGEYALDAPSKELLKTALKDRILEEALDDPAALFLVIVFADKSGAADLNKKLSKERANSGIDLVKKECRIPNLAYPLAIGSTEIVTPENKDINRAAELWLVLP